MAEHKHGEMDITDQKRAFEGFLKAGVYLGIAVVIALLFLALINS
ncbi:MAG: aa3-type cytochrome c oxidase subunit IV [Pseudomonadota bacterium]